MSRIPYRALGRPLSGKNGRFNRIPTALMAHAIPTVEGTPAIDGVTPIETTSTDDVVVEPATVPTTDSSTASDEVTAIDDLVASVDDFVVDAASTPQPKWEPTWTKSQLIAVAQGMGLSVTSSNTKTEIVAALTAAG
jgi:hypothetical protein